jgi:hypothetical protein
VRRVGHDLLARAANMPDCAAAFQAENVSPRGASGCLTLPGDLTVCFGSPTQAGARYAFNMSIAFRLFVVIYVSQAAIGAAVGFALPWLALP